MEIMCFTTYDNMELVIVTNWKVTHVVTTHSQSSITQSMLLCPLNVIMLTRMTNALGHMYSRYCV